MLDYPILYADDDPNDIFFVKSALAYAKKECTVQVVSDGLLAIEYLAGNGDYKDRSRYPLPSIILSDLKMPRVSGLGLLRWIRQQAFLDSVPTILLSSWDDPWDIKTACELGANGFILKETISEDLADTFKDLLEVCGKGAGRINGWLDFFGNQPVPLGDVHLHSLRTQLARARQDYRGPVDGDLR